MSNYSALPGCVLRVLYTHQRTFLGLFDFMFTICLFLSIKRSWRSCVCRRSSPATAWDASACLSPGQPFTWSTSSAAWAVWTGPTPTLTPVLPVRPTSEPALNSLRCWIISFLNRNREKRSWDVEWEEEKGLWADEYRGGHVQFCYLPSCHANRHQLLQTGPTVSKLGNNLVFIIANIQNNDIFLKTLLEKKLKI